MRRIFILLCCIMIMISLAVSASAYSMGWEDYVITTGIDRDGEFYSVAKFPTGDTTITVSDKFNLLQRKNATSLTYTFPAGSTPYWIVYPLGIYGDIPNMLRLLPMGGATQGIPNGTHMLFDITVDYSANQLKNATMIFDIDFYDANMNYISYERLTNEVGNLPYTWNVEYTMNAPSGAVYAVPYISMRSSSAIASAMSFGVSVGSLMLELDLEFKDWRDTIGDINNGINGSYDANLPEQPDFEPIVSFNPFIAGVLEDFDIFLMNFSTFFNDFARGLDFWVLLLDKVFEIRFIRMTIYLVMILGVTGFALNLLVIVPSRVSSAPKVNRFVRSEVSHD